LNAPARHRYLTLDGMRGVAAFAVVLYHLRTSVAPYTLVAGYLAVDLFFVLSGFVIAGSYEGRLTAGSLSSRRFLWVRLVRLYPLYILGTALGLLSALVSLILKGHVISVYVPAWQAAPFAAAMLPNPSVDPAAPLFQLDAPCWSLFFELVVNLVYAVSWRLWTTPRLLVLVVALGAVTLWIGGGDQGWNGLTAPYGLLRVLFAFPAGVLIYRFRRLGQRLPRVPSWALLFSMAVLLTQPWRPFSQIAVVIGFPLLVLLGANSEPARWWRPGFAEAGDISYAVYAVHLPLLDAAHEWAPKLHLSGHALAVGLLVTAALVPVGMIADRFYDGPTRAALGRLPSLLRLRSRGAVAALRGQ
jgi:peptidoglycan/LPS O-acetylase OafA/YrhL